MRHGSLGLGKLTELEWPVAGKVSNETPWKALVEQRTEEQFESDENI